MAEISDTDHTKTLDQFIKIMTEIPEWAEGMPIKADGWEGYRYRK